jgi:DNA-binding FrmR family transcriptional regulator
MVGMKTEFPMATNQRKTINVRLNRIAGQVAGVQKMVEEKRYCVDILTQLAAIRSALDAVGVQLLTDHIDSCVLGHGTATAHQCARKLTKGQLLAEVRRSIERFV